jgi:hypothetical protein
VNLTEDQIRTVIRIACDELGENATFERVQDLVRRSISALEQEGASGAVTSSTGDVLILCISPDAGRNSLVLSEGLQNLNCRETERCEHRLGPFQVTLANIRLGAGCEDPAVLRRELAQAGNLRGVRVILVTEDLLKR